MPEETQSERRRPWTTPRLDPIDCSLSDIAFGIGPFTDGAVATALSES